MKQATLDMPENLQLIKRIARELHYSVIEDGVDLCIFDEENPRLVALVARKRKEGKRLPRFDPAKRTDEELPAGTFEYTPQGIVQALSFIQEVDALFDGGDDDDL